MATAGSSSSTIKTFLISLSGPSCSGKTTLARFLRSIFNHPSTSSNTPSISLSILHQDDYYLTDTDIPLITTSPTCPSGLGSRQLQDWDCIGSLDLPLMSKTLDHVKQHGTLPPDSHSKEDQNEVGPTTVPDSVVETLKRDVGEWWTAAQTLLPSSTTSTSASTTTSSTPNPAEIRIYLLEGFLLFPCPPSPSSPSSTSPSTHLHALISTHSSAKLWVSATRTQAITRRNRRKGYVTLEGFWEDPEGYVEDVVWPGFVREHLWMEARIGEGEGRGKGEEERGWETKEKVEVNEAVVREKGEEIWVAPEEGGMEKAVEWGVGAVKRVVEEGLRKER